MLKTLGKYWSMALVASMSIVGIVAVDAQKAEALQGSSFNPGLIISDSVFYNSSTMSIVEIQRFLDGKVSACRAGSSRPGCLKDYRLSTPAVTGTAGRCASLPAKSNISAAELIYDVARACNINPRVLLVKLQKEQGLVTSTDPSPRAYEFALGMNCPDSPAGCSAASAGFFWQLYKGAGQLNWYSNPAGSFTWLRVGATISRQYQANNTACGSQSFVLQNKATAALYYYTPYVPNQAALNNLYSTGDACSAYGNRNFWRDYTNWFGSTIGGGFLVKAASGDTFLIVDEIKYRVPTAAQVSSLAPLGPVGTISTDLLASYRTAGDINGLALNAANSSYFFIHNGQRLAFANCTEVAAWGLNCANAVTLTSHQVSALAPGQTMASLAGSFVVESGSLRQAGSTPSAQPAPAPAPAAPAAATTYTVVSGDTLSRIASRFGTTVSNIVALNSIANPRLIRPGQVFVLSAAAPAPTPTPTPTPTTTPTPTPTPTPSSTPTPTPTPTPTATPTTTPEAAAVTTSSYTVAPGDTLIRIASRFGTTAANIMALNGITNPNLIRVGRVLTISGTAPAATPSPVAAAPAPTSSRPAFSVALRRGSTGEAVRYLQSALGLRVDGQFGPVTERAVRAFQAANGLRVDGIVGSITWSKLP